MKKAVTVYIEIMAIFLAALMIPGMAAGNIAKQGGDDVLSKLNLAPAAAKEGALVSLTSGIVNNDAAFKAFKILPAAARAEIVRAGLGWVKSYTATAEFKASYQELRDKEKPKSPAPPISVDDETKKMKSDMEKSIAEMRQNMAAMDAETRQAMEAAIQQMRAQMETMEKNPEQRETMRQAKEMSATEDQKSYKKKLEAWEKQYPADPRALIKMRIKAFLTASAGIDFAAKLMPQGKKMVFANAQYEQKPPEWKLCFRAGREATEAARAFAQSWLAELDKM